MKKGSNAASARRRRLLYRVIVPAWLLQVACLLGFWQLGADVRYLSALLGVIVLCEVVRLVALYRKPPSETSDHDN